jgi:hypothetical protein
MTWYKAWLDTRWRFLIGLVVLAISACSLVLGYDDVLALLPLAPANAAGELGRRISEAAELARDYRGYVWSQWFRQNLVETWTIFAALLGAGSVLAGRGAVFTLSLPVRRTDWLTARAAVGLSQLLVLAVVPSLVIPALSPAVGQRYAITEAVMHGLFVFTGGAVFFSLACLLSTIFAGVWRPLLIVLAVAFTLAAIEQVAGGSWFGVFRLMSGESYFRGGAIAVAGLVTMAATAMALLYAAKVNLARQDF